MRQIRLHHAHVRDRVAELPQRLDELLPLLRVAGPAHDHHHDRLAVQLRRDERAAAALSCAPRSSSGRPARPRPSRGRSAAPRPTAPSARRSAPPATCVPSGTQLNSNSVTIPKFPPPPRRPQNRSGFSSALALTNSPSAVTTSIEMSLSTDRPCLRWIQPIPPPSVSPADSGVRDDPRRHREPERLRLLVELAEQHTGLHAHRHLLRIDAHALHRLQVDHQRVVRD